MTIRQQERAKLIKIHTCEKQQKRQFLREN